MNFKTLLKPTIWKIVFAILLFIVFQILDLLFGFGGGFGFPFKFFALGFAFLNTGFFNSSYMVIDILFFYILTAIFIYSKIGRVTAIVLLFGIFLYIDRPFRGISFFVKPEQQRLDLKQRCEASMMHWTDGTGSNLGTCQ